MISITPLILVFDICHNGTSCLPKIDGKTREKLYLKGQITNYKPAIQITSISIKSDSIPLSGEFGHIVRVIGVPFLALNCDRCTADKSAVYIKCRPHKCLHLTIIMICI